MVQTPRGWYEGFKERILPALKGRYSMVILSNSTAAVRDMNFSYFQMGDFFDRWYDTESYANAPKSAIIRSIMEDYAIESPKELMVIGDRASDMAAARAAGCAFMGCLYGYGSRQELEGADYLVDTPEEILELLFGMSTPKSDISGTFKKKIFKNIVDILLPIFVIFIIF